MSPKKRRASTSFRWRLVRLARHREFLALIERIERIEWGMTPETAAAVMAERAAIAEIADRSAAIGRRSSKCADFQYGYESASEDIADIIRARPAPVVEPADRESVALACIRCFMEIPPLPVEEVKRRWDTYSPAMKEPWFRVADAAIAALADLQRAEG